MTRAEEKATDAYPVEICGYTVECRVGAKPEPQDWNEERRKCFQEGYEQAEKDTIQRIKYLLKVRIAERTCCQEDWSNWQKDRVNIRNDEDGDIILVLEKLEEE